MNIDPRAPLLEQTIAAHETKWPESRKVLALLKIETPAKPIYFVVEENSEFGPTDQMVHDVRCYVEEHACPVVFVDVEFIYTGGDDDPHGLFEMVDAVWMTTEYHELVENRFRNYGPDGLDAYMKEVFPQLKGERDDR